jgi:transcriptional regulator with XRE-family HTH domain
MRNKKGVETMAEIKYPNIEAERVRKGLSQDELAEKLHCERKSYFNWLTTGKIPGTILVSLAEMFDCSTDYLLGRTRNPIINQ